MNAAQAAEAAAMLGSPLFTTTVDQAGIAAAYPELVRAAECPVLDTSCAALLRLAAVGARSGLQGRFDRRRS